jgi:glycogen(starch) synthase
MKVLMTADAVGGVWTYASELIEGLAERDVEVTLAVLGPSPTREQRRRLCAGSVARYAERNYALEWMDDPWTDLDRTALWLLELVDTCEPDLVHLNGFALGALPLTVPKLVVGHSCVLSWHESVYRTQASPAWERYAVSVRQGLAGAEMLVAPTHAMRETLERLYDPTCPREVIPNGLASAGAPPDSKKPYVLGVGRVWDEAKNLEALERIARRLSWPVVIAGTGGSLGHVGASRLDTLYGGASVFAAPARYEPFGLAALEAACAGCALVLGDLASLREVWGDAALYVDPFDDDDLAVKLERVIDDPRLRDSLAAAAARRRMTYSRERMAGAYRDVYERLTMEAKVEAPLADVRL